MCVKGDQSATQTIISPEKERAHFRNLAREILQEMLALVTLRRFQGVVIPVEERRQYARIFGLRAAGTLLASLSSSLWKEMDRYEAATGRHDFGWLDLQLSSRLSAFPERARPLLLAYLTALRNVVPGLNPSGLRVAATELAARCQVAMGTLFKYQQEIAKELESRSLPVIPDPIEGQRQSVIAAHHVQRVTSDLWETTDAPQAVESALKTRIAVETDPEILRQLGAYLEALRNVSADLNPSSKRVSAAQIAQPRSSNAHTIFKYQEEIERELSRRSLRVLPDPEEKRKKSRVAGHRFRRTIPTIWEGREKVRDVEAFLRERISAETEEETKQCLSVYLAVLRNVSAELNPTGRRVSVGRVSPRYGLTLVTLARYQDEIVLELSRRSLPFLRDPQGERLSQAKLATTGIQEAIAAVWEGKTTIVEIARALQARVEGESDLARKKYLAVYADALHNISRDLNPSGLRKNASEIARASGISNRTVINYQEAIGKKLAERSLAVIPDPQEKHAKIGEATYRLRRLASDLWKAAKKAEDMDAALAARIVAEAEPEVKKYLGVYLTVLRNVSADLNPSGTRKSAEELGPLCGVTPHTTLRYQREIERELTGKSLSILPDLGQKIAQGTLAGYRLRGMLPKIWEGKESAAEVAQSLEALIATEADEATRKYLKAYLAALRELSPSANPQAPRETAKDIAQRCGVTDTTYRNYRKAIQEKLSEKNWPPAHASSSVSGPTKK